jgi:hypothetical protein
MNLQCASDRLSDARNPVLCGWCLSLLLFSFSPPTVRAQETVDGSQEIIAPTIPLTPMTHINEQKHLGYFGDPYPVRVAPWITTFSPQYFSGTTQELMTCERPIRPGCFQTSNITVTIPDDLRSTAKNAGNEFFDQINRNIYQDNDGRWNMAITLYLRKQSAPKTSLNGSWTVIAHAHPEMEGSLSAPTSWIVDEILVGSLVESAKANYDGKYFEDDGRLYLIYSKREMGTVHDGIVAQAMKSPRKPAPTDPVWLLAPNTVGGGFNSEYFHINWADGGPNSDFKLIETGNITKIAGKYVMAYSTGDYQQLDYKTGLAYSDTLLPKTGEMYRRILLTDTNGVWGDAGHMEVRYLLQSDKQAWPNYVAKQVFAPGVPSIVQEPSGKFFLYFDGFLPSDAPKSKSAPLTSYDATYRRPFYVPLSVRVPYNGSVEAAKDEDLAFWITVSSQ